MEKFVLALIDILISAAVLSAIIFPILYAIKKHKYRKFVLKHSASLKQLEEINNRYSFYIVPNMDQEHSYDNEDFYNEISCEDYLIYQLVYIRKKVTEAANATLDNNKMFNKYLLEIKEKCKLDEYDVPVELKDSKFLHKVESKMILEKTQCPVTEFKLKVRLTLTNINGYFKASKTETFDIETIRFLVRRVMNQRNGFYLDREIWDSICRVERGKVSNRMRFSIYERDGNRCRKCGSRYNLEIDHIIPISRGGKSTYDNLQTLCHRCNMEKGSDIE